MRLLKIAAAVLLLALPAWGDSAGKYKNGSCGSGKKVTVETRLSATHNDLEFRLISEDGTSSTGWKDAEADPAGDGRDILNSNPADTITLDGERYRWKDGKLQELKDGGDPANPSDWCNVPKVKVKKKAEQPCTLLIREGDVVPFDGTLYTPDFAFSADVKEGDIAPFDGFLAPGDELVSLP
jgi:hypothetical protein